MDLDPETGETVCVDREIINDDIKPIKKAASKKKAAKKDESKDPMLVLSENKYSINNAAVELLGLDLDEENRLDIKYEKKGKTSVPVFGTSTAFGTPSKGNKLTKSLTVACRGKANDELAAYGTEFVITPHPTKSDLFVLVGSGTVEVPDGDENIGEPDTSLVIPREVDDDNLDLAGLIEDDDNDTDGFDFNL